MKVSIAHENTINDVKFSQSNPHLIGTASDDSNYKIWDIRTNKLIQHYTSHTQSINSVAFHPCGNYLLTASNDSTLKIFDLFFVADKLFKLNTKRYFNL